MEPAALFEKIVAMCGVSAVLAPGLVRRALTEGPARADGTRPTVETATVADWKAAMPRLLARLRAYMPESEAQQHARRISSALLVLEGGPAGPGGEASSAFASATEHLRSMTPSQGIPRAGGSVPPESLLEFEDDVTMTGRRYTSAELEAVRAAGAIPAIVGHGSTPPPGDDKR